MEKTENLELSLLLTAIEQRWGHEFSGYGQAFIKRRIRKAMSRHGLQHISELIPRVLHETNFFQGIIQDISIPVTEMFRDPHFWVALREQVFPLLRTWPYFKIWHAGCATGNEVYSLAILLEEAGLLQRATIYATDFNDVVLQKARAGVFSLKEIQEASANYLKAGGQFSLNQYYHAHGDGAEMKSSLKKQIVWANHNLTVDNVFGEMNLILCRNVLIYFNQPLQNRALELFTDSLVTGGYLCLGNKESLDFSSVSRSSLSITPRERIYRYQFSHGSEGQDAAKTSVARGNQAGGGENSGGAVTASNDSDGGRGVLAIGCSLGGLQALRILLPGLPADFPLPVLVTQHIAPSPSSAMAEVLQKNCALTVREAISGERIRPGNVYLAPADYHLLLNDDGTLALSSEERDTYARPSINVMFEAVADVYGTNAIGVLLTGANSDGAQGLAMIKAAGGFVIVQDPDSAEAPAMPRAALQATKADCVLPLEAMVRVITTQSRLRGGPR